MNRREAIAAAAALILLPEQPQADRVHRAVCRIMREIIDLDRDVRVWAAPGHSGRPRRIITANEAASTPGAVLIPAKDITVGELSLLVSKYTPQQAVTA